MGLLFDESIIQQPVWLTRWCGRCIAAGAARQARPVRLVSLDQCDLNKKLPLYVLLEFSINKPT